MTWLYDNPDTMNYDSIDEPIRELIKKINNSGWMKTEESCCGHPVNEYSAWGSAPEFYLRFVSNNLERVFWMVDNMRKSYTTWFGHVSLSYDRKDSLGIHWFLKATYSELNNRSLAIQFTEMAFDEASMIVCGEQSK